MLRIVCKATQQLYIFSGDSSIQDRNNGGAPTYKKLFIATRMLYSRGHQPFWNCELLVWYTLLK